MNSFRHVYRATSVGFAAFAGLALVSGCCSSGGHKTASYQQTSATYAETQPAPAATEQAAAPTPTGRMEGTTVVPLYEEKINVGKREVDTGSVTIKKVVKTETVNQPIELRHEEIIVERQPGGAAVSGNKILDQPFQEGQQTVTAKSEVAVIEKQTTTSGQVVLSTRSSTTQTNIQGEVRREEVAIDKQGGESTGAAESPGGKASASSGTITDPSMLSTSSDASQWNGRQVQFTGVKVRRVVGDKIFVLDGGNGQQIFVFNKEEANTCKAGDLMNVNGTIKTRADSSLGQAAQDLASAPYYIEADKCEVSNK